MSKATRSKISIVGFITFIILIIGVFSVIAILVAQGRLSPNGGLVSTGSIRVNSDPVDVTAYINGQQVSIQDKLITGLTPGTYTLRLTRNGYLPWEKELKIQAGLVEDVYTKLFPQQLNLQQVTRSNVASTKFANNGEYLYFVVPTATKGEDIGIWRQRIADSTFSFLNQGELLKITNITDEVKSAINDGKYELLPSRDNRKLILKVTAPSVRHYILDAGSYNEPTVANSLEGKLGYAISGAKWLRNADTVLVASSNLLAEYDVNSGESKIIGLNNGSETTLPYAIAEDKVYFYTSHRQAGPTVAPSIKVYQGGQVANLKLENIGIADQITAIYTNSENANHLVYKTDKGELYYVNILKSFRKLVGENLQVRELSKDGSSVLLANASNELSVFNAKEIKALNTIETSVKAIVLPKAAAEDAALKVVSSKFSPLGGNLLLLTENNILFIADNDGNNPVQILNEKATLVTDGFGINSSNSKLFLLLNEKKAGDNGQGAINNIYTIELRAR
jgi:WD40 repeat protein